MPCQGNPRGSLDRQHRSRVEASDRSGSRRDHHRLPSPSDDLLGVDPGETVKPIHDLDPRGIQVVLTDLDDTLTDHGQITPDAYSALWDLQKAGFKVGIVSGRPAGWADALIRLWPVDAMVFENGAGFVYREGPKVLRTFLASSEARLQAQTELDQVFAEIRSQIPAAKLASDQSFRLFDYAIDFAEEPPLLSETEVTQILELLRSHPEITAKLSSIHINFWKGSHTKLDACRILLQDLWKTDPKHVLYCGDSPNDEPMFEAFDRSVGVANIQDFVDRLLVTPQYITRSRGGSGFREIVARLLTPAQSF